MLTRLRRGVLLLSAIALAAVLPLVAVRDVTAESEDHTAHHRMMEEPRYARAEAEYEVPDLTLVNQDGQRVPLRAVVGGAEPVALNFVFTTCNTICPVMTATFVSMRRELGSAADALRMVSISIDPEHDTPQVLRAYAARHGVGPGWQLLTGEPEQVVRVLKAFNAYAGGKTNHRPLSFLRVPGHVQWLRIDGLASAADLAAEYRRLRAGG